MSKMRKKSQLSVANREQTKLMLSLFKLLCRDNVMLAIKDVSFTIITIVIFIVIRTHIPGYVQCRLELAHMNLMHQSILVSRLCLSLCSSLITVQNKSEPRRSRHCFTTAVGLELIIICKKLLFFFSLSFQIIISNPICHWLKDTRIRFIPSTSFSMSKFFERRDTKVTCENCLQSSFQAQNCKMKFKCIFDIKE